MFMTKKAGKVFFKSGCKKTLSKKIYTPALMPHLWSAKKFGAKKLKSSEQRNQLNFVLQQAVDCQFMLVGLVSAS